ncbi:hypothetical protein BKA67DRAFT_532662 [Truncatella angustata]|uniref:Uncharacterized protein n=1 Tax=Truncatella angustata TaxID=152316 RepID=A0A9P9A0N4_9PEZI|nr:uncharacterized protein BKA67DRAFT_532662 [Truncatella angustata]KAH6657453.1 hypothetical protein BKA67DRAFT_532662 [Truncatella angustata]
MVIKELFGDATSTKVHISQYVNLALLVDRLVKCGKSLVKKDAAAEALNSLSAYYQRFIDDITIEVVEEKLLAVLSDLLSRVVVSNMADAKLEAVAGMSIGIDGVLIFVFMITVEKAL